ncbi:1687_t:CDS:2 [Gigaspora rosea]|nr:1687_t:CDS:2 [Gigaspora rosea]
MNELNDNSGERNIEETFQMPKSWAFPANAKFKKKGGGKRIKAEVVNILKQFFLNGNLNPKDKMTAKEMHEELLKFARTGEIEDDHVPQLTTIQNWIGRYAREFNQEGTAIALNSFRAIGPPQMAKFIHLLICPFLQFTFPDLCNTKIFAVAVSGLVREDLDDENKEFLNEVKKCLRFNHPELKLCIERIIDIGVHIRTNEKRIGDKIVKIKANNTIEGIFVQVNYYFLNERLNNTKCQHLIIFLATDARHSD